MKIAIKSFVASVIWIGFLLGGHVIAQEDSLFPKEIPAGQTEPEATADESTPAFMFSQAEPEAASEGTVSLHGGTYGGCPLGPCCEVCGEGNCCPPDWYVEQGVHIMTRSTPRFLPLSYNLEEIPPSTLAVLDRSTRDFGFDISAGYATTLGRYLGRDAENRNHFVEFTYWGLNSWNDWHNISGRRMTKTQDFFHIEGEGENQVATLLPVTFGTLMSPFGLSIYSNNQHQSRVGGFNRADRHSLFYTSDINNFEVNGRIRPRSRADRLVLHPNGKWRRECQPGGYLSYVFGLRMMSMNERFDFHSEGQIDITNYDPITQQAVFYGSTPVSGDYRVRTNNDLVGLQIGGDWIYRQCKWTWGIRAKAGPFINFEDMASHLAINATPAVWDTEAGMFVSVGDPYLPADAQNLDIRRSARRTGAALVGEVGVVGTYKVNPHLTLRAAYDIVWVTGLALAPEQLVFETNPPDKLKINDNGHYFLQGITLGGEFLW